MVKKKRTSLDDILPAKQEKQRQAKASQAPEQEKPGRRPHVKQQTLYLPLSAHKRLKLLALEEEKKMHDLLLEGLDMLFVNRGLPTIQVERTKN